MSFVVPWEVLLRKLFQAIHGAFFEKFFDKRILDIRKVKSICQISFFDYSHDTLFVDWFLRLHKILLGLNNWIFLWLDFSWKPFVKLVAQFNCDCKWIIKDWLRSLVWAAFSHLAMAFRGNFLALIWCFYVEDIAVLLVLSCLKFLNMLHLLAIVGDIFLQLPIIGLQKLLNFVRIMAILRHVLSKTDRCFKTFSQTLLLSYQTLIMSYFVEVLWLLFFKFLNIGFMLKLCTLKTLRS